MPVLSRVIAAIAVPWNVFVAAFVYYVGLTLCAVGLSDLPASLVAIAYLLPPILYLAVLLSRALRALASLPIELGRTPHAISH